jgi:hypothetical protein
MKKRVITWQLLILAAVFSLGAKIEQTPVIQKAAKPAGSAIAPGGAIEGYKNMQQEAQPIIENILKAMNEQNHAHYIRDFNIPMKAAYPKDVFKKNMSLLRGRIGKYVSVTPVKIERVKQRFVFYYNAKFTKARGPVTVRLVLERYDNKLLVCFLSFDAPELKDPDVKK